MAALASTCYVCASFWLPPKEPLKNSRACVVIG
jgi:hypothetical protein